MEMMVILAKGLGLPRDMLEPLEGCILVGWSALCVHLGGFAKTPFLPGYIEVICKDYDRIVEEYRRRGYRIYRGKRHTTITDGVWDVRIWRVEFNFISLELRTFQGISLLIPSDKEEIKEFIRRYCEGKSNLKNVL